MEFIKVGASLKSNECDLMYYCEKLGQNVRIEILKPCSQNALCIPDNNAKPQCICKSGFIGNGFECTLRPVMAQLTTARPTSLQSTTKNTQTKQSTTITTKLTSKMTNISTTRLMPTSPNLMTSKTNTNALTSSNPTKLLVTTQQNKNNKEDFIEFAYLERGMNSKNSTLIDYKVTYDESKHQL